MDAAIVTHLIKTNAHTMAVMYVLLICSLEFVFIIYQNKYLHTA